MNQTAFALTCPRCGKPLASLVDLAHVADRLHEEVTRMKLRVPIGVESASAVLKSSLRCHSMRCEPEVA